ncbi:MAG: uroporphyrinogen-III C-methyltransferase [Rhodospirillales bacterium]|nr:uroporphyrinogen-III C-methyltransferase [Rhodospirillales bacterium]
MSVTRVFLVGAGPGDPDLLTVKALRLLQRAEVVIYDRLVSEAVIDLVPRSVARLFVGKTAGCHPVPQDRINELLVDLARGGKTVVRLKGGDPFIFGRGSEEAEYLARHGIAFEVVPGVTAASGCAAALNLPLTHRGLASGVRYVTGHRREDGELDLDWQGMADADTTLVVYMGVANLPLITARLIAAGMSPDMPAAAVAEGTTSRQKVVMGSLRSLHGLITAARLEAPVLLIIGRVVSMATVLNAGCPPEETRRAGAMA